MKLCPWQLRSTGPQTAERDKETDKSQGRTVAGLWWNHLRIMVQMRTKRVAIQAGKSDLKLGFKLGVILVKDTNILHAFPDGTLG